MRFRFIEEHGRDFPTNRLCQVLDVSERGLRAYRSRPASQRQRTDMVVLAHIKEQSRLSLGSYGRPRMTEELKELGLNIGHRRVGRLMRENGIRVERSKKYKVTTDSNHAFNIAPNLLNRDFRADQPNQKWAGDISYVWTREGWLYLAVLLDLHSRRVIGWGGQQSYETRPGHPGFADGCGATPAAQGLHSPHRPWQPILLPRLSEAPTPARLPGIDERQGQLLRQLRRRNLLQNDQG